MLHYLRSLFRPKTEPRRCLALAKGSWKSVQIVGTLDDGTYAVLPDDSHLPPAIAVIIGVPEEQLSHDDESRWKEAKSTLNSQAVLTLDDLADWLLRLLQCPYGKHCLFLETARITAELKGKSTSIECPEGYQLLRKLGLSAKGIIEATDAPPRRLQFYDHTVRVGGRSPSEVPRAIEVADVFGVLGVEKADAGLAMSSRPGSQSGSIPEAVRLLAENQLVVERFRVVNAGTMNLLAGRQLVPHPASPNELGIDWWMEVVVPDEGWEFSWVLGYRAGEPNPRVFFAEPPYNDLREWRLVADTFTFFIWDVIQTRLCFFRYNRYRLRTQLRPFGVSLKV